MHSEIAKKGRASQYIHSTFTTADVKNNNKDNNNLQSFNTTFTTFTEQEQDPPVLKELCSVEFIRLLRSFADWLRLLNFEPSTLKYAPSKLQEFLSWLESKGITETTAITSTIVSQFFEYLFHRTNRTKGGRLSKNYLRSHGTNLRRFARFLRESGNVSFDVRVRITGSLYNIKHIFTKAEITALYEAAGCDIIGQRDKALLAVYYGCGLRRSEGVNLDLADVLFDRNLLFVRKGKYGKDRYVPMTAGVQDNLKDYILNARPFLLKQPSAALFLNQYGGRVIRETMSDRLHYLKAKAGIDKQAGLHCLRHSIATHLLQSGMELEKIQLFLGHCSLESTQIYTHISNEIQI